jgi:hypothetical protein
MEDKTKKRKLVQLIQKYQGVSTKIFGDVRVDINSSNERYPASRYYADFATIREFKIDWTEGKLSQKRDRPYQKRFSDNLRKTSTLEVLLPEFLKKEVEWSEGITRANHLIGEFLRIYSIQAQKDSSYLSVKLHELGDIYLLVANCSNSTKNNEPSDAWGRYIPPDKLNEYPNRGRYSSVYELHSTGIFYVMPVFGEEPHQIKRKLILKGYRTKEKLK